METISFKKNKRPITKLLPFLLIFFSLFIFISCSDNDHIDIAPNVIVKPGDLTIELTEEGLWFEQNGLPYSNGDTGTKMLCLNGLWKFMEDPEDRGIKEGWESPDQDISWWRTIEVPGVWNAAFEDLFHYEGIGWFALDIDISE